MKAFAIVMLVAISAVNAQAARADLPQLSPFIADYDVGYGSMTVGSSRTELRRAAIPGQWLIESRSKASGLARLFVGGTFLQSSTFLLGEDGLRPLSYRFDDGTKRSDKDVTLDFDWVSGRVKGVSEGKPVDVAAEAGLQDAASMQAFVLLRMNGGAEPGMIAMIEKDSVKLYRYTLLRRERLKTAIGELDTLVYRSARDGSSREVLLWYAPALGNVNVQAEQRNHGKRLFHTHIRKYRPGT
jgi:hypothetical protein